MSEPVIPCKHCYSTLRLKAIQRKKLMWCETCRCGWALSSPYILSFYRKKSTIALTALEGTWVSRCCACGTTYRNGVGSTPCCGSVQEIIEHYIDNPEPDEKV